MWPFRRKPIVDDETAAWHAENFAWLVREFGGQSTLAKHRLILPKPGYFNSGNKAGHAQAVHIFEQVKAYCGMSDWATELIEDDNPLARESKPSVAMLAPTKHALGTFRLGPDIAVITYVPSLLAKPQILIATLAHELAHYLLASALTKPPCYNDERECLTDLAAIYLGFGVFLANARVEFETFSDGLYQGWRIGRTGYLPEADIIYALALFMHTKEIEPEPAYNSLKPHLVTMLRRTLRGMNEGDANVALIKAALGADD